MLIHQRNEANIVGCFNEMRHLMDNDIFKKLRWLTRQFSIEAKACVLCSAVAPFGLHLSQPGGHGGLQNPFGGDLHAITAAALADDPAS